MLILHVLYADITSVCVRVKKEKSQIHSYMHTIRFINLSDFIGEFVKIKYSGWESIPIMCNKNSTDICWWMKWGECNVWGDNAW